MKLVPKEEPDLGMDFDSFAKSHAMGKGPRCGVCRLTGPMLELIQAKHEQGHASSIIGRFLRTKNYQIAEATVARHFRERHGIE